MVDRYDRNNICFDSVAPKGAAGWKIGDDIPVAQRSRPANARVGAGWKPFALISSFIFFLTFLLLRYTPLSSYFLKSTSAPSYIESELIDGRLLGHFPYQEARQEDLVSVYPGLELDRDTFNSLEAMRIAAKRDGINLIYLSGFRSHKLQEEIFFDLKSIRNQTAKERARVSAPPGYSEHSTGYAIDLGDGNRRETDFTVAFANTQAFKWLQRNAAKYHFIMSFPESNRQGVSYEPWHWRFEGSAEALREFEAARRFIEQN